MPSNEERLSVGALMPGRLAGLLLGNRDALMDRWKRRVLEDPGVPSANPLSTPALEDHIPKLIGILLMRLARHPSEAWGERVGREVGSSDEMGVAHAQHRFAIHYSITEAMRELSHFRSALLELCEENSIVLTFDETKLLHATIDELMTTSATELERSGLRAREEVMAVVAHDLQNPISTIAGWATRMEAGKMTEPEKTGAILARSAKRMQRLVEDLLMLAKLEAGHLSVRVADVDVSAIVRETVEQLRAYADRKHIAVTSTLPAEDVRLNGDRDRLGQALGNLLSNAIKFSPDSSSVVIDLTTEPDQCVLRVRDSGPGISPEHVEDVFRPFWQAHAGAKEGLGLGLAITRGIIEAHGGAIRVESAGEGASFVVLLPYEGLQRPSATLRGMDEKP
jgi:signal transduction histidine kinase